MAGERRWARRWAGATVAIFLAALAATAAAGPGGAQTGEGRSVTGPQLQALAARAVDDPRALAQLRAVQQVDGRAVDVATGLGGAEGPALQERLRTLASGTTAAPADVVAADARRDAETVLRGRRFKPSRVPRPLAGVLGAVGRRLQPVLEPLGAAWALVVASVAGRVGMVASVFGIAVLISVRVVGRRSPQSVHRSRPFAVDLVGVDPDQLEREAMQAERAGDLDHAVRLRFVAGVLRLDRAGVVAYRASMTTGQIASRLRSASFAGLATAFDEIAYGGRPAEQSDVEAATTGWPRILEEARR